MVDRVKPLRIESPDSGGTQTDDFPTSTNKNQEFFNCRRLTTQIETYGVKIQDVREVQ